ncbi:riboflavin biosynthesis protein RibD [Pirellula staleyi DSM 6068]|uniref:Riboflavin biosynthesis protein RibD n=1 Tax=Pirellula staleyi (strain ATCC 27377 / DSM 6068 / ICPB 4128) TaxID=530564 RepID=D2QZR9_PIRSD|nr:bifunctional diaminohydroxyphosphoribosylaminopyrimidine deaminase/5-amino-6-(5-phosphoribosylamino)uracil reductase RibD [Pirellula staleyi]ADB16552.1 riboflavin biosynthesis protein RibD [Pirellula staleyi DSM 6068]
MSAIDRGSAASDEAFMREAIELAERGLGLVEPNPMVGCVIVSPRGEVVGRGWHGRFGGPHAEVEALQQAGEQARGSTLYVTLEPCSHFGKTPPCADAVIAAGVARVVAAMTDPFPKVQGGGFAKLRSAGIAVESGVCEAEARALCAPYLKLVTRGMPWVIAKWAMTLDGKIATRSGYSQWISCSQSRELVHGIRGRVDGIMVGRRTVELDDPLLTARPPGKRTPARIVLDSQARLQNSTQLVRTARQSPVLVVTGPEADDKEIRRLSMAGCEVLPFLAATHFERLLELLSELGRRQMTNILVEGGAKLLGSLLDARLVDEVHVFIAPKLFGGERAPGPVAGAGVEQVASALELRNLKIDQIGTDLYVSGRLHK